MARNNNRKKNGQQHRSNSRVEDEDITNTPSPPRRPPPSKRHPPRMQQNHNPSPPSRSSQPTRSSPRTHHHPHPYHTGDCTRLQRKFKKILLETLEQAARSVESWLPEPGENDDDGSMEWQHEYTVFLEPWSSMSYNYGNDMSAAAGSGGTGFMGGVQGQAGTGATDQGPVPSFDVPCGAGAGAAKPQRFNLQGFGGGISGTKGLGDEEMADSGDLGAVT